MGTQVIPANLLQWGLLSPQGRRTFHEPVDMKAFHRIRACFGHIYPLCWRSSVGYMWLSAPSWPFMGCRETACLTVIFYMECREISALLPGAPSSLTLVSAEVFSSHVITPDRWWCCIGFPARFHVCSHRSTITITDGHSLGQHWDHLETDWYVVSWKWEKPLIASHSSHSVAPPLPKLQCKPNENSNS